MSDVLWEYEPIKESGFSRYIGSYETYGIRITGTNRLTDTRMLYIIHDVCCEYSVVQALVSQCNSLSLEYCHLADVIADFLP